jgi:hypothetical protein
MAEKTAAFRQWRAADTARWRERLKNGRALPIVESVAGSDDGRDFIRIRPNPATDGS